MIRVAEEIPQERGLHAILLGALIARGFFLGELDLRAAPEVNREGLPLSRRLGQRAQTLMFVNNIGYTSFRSATLDCAAARWLSGPARRARPRTVPEAPP